MKVGLELEYWTVDQRGRLISSKELAQRLDSGEQEFVEPLLELKTSPHENTADLREEAESILREALLEAQELGLKIVPLGTPMNSGKIDKIGSRRGEIQEQIIGENLEAAKRVAGTHIHFEKENVKEQLNILTALDPALALMNSSPFYQGEKLASSSRNQVYRKKCYRDFPRHGQLWRYVDSVEEWEERIEERFEEFKEAGRKEGVTSTEIEEHFGPYDALWTPVRLRKQFPTVEWRAPDSGNIEDALRLAKESKDIVERASEECLKPEILDFEDLQRLSEKAIKNGLDDEDVKNYLSDLGFSIGEYTQYQQNIGNSLNRKKAKELRLKESERLEENYSNLKSV